MKSPQAWASKPADAGLGGAGRDQRSARRRHGAVIAGTAITALLASTLVPAATAFAVPPVFPDNITIFPERDMVVADYPSRNGQTVEITVTRGATVTGSASGTISNGLLEVNHPGGVCWGTNPAVVAAATPDIKGGDLVTLRFSDGTTDTAMTQSPTVTSFSQPTPNRIVVLGDLTVPGGTAPNTAQMEQRIIEPALVGTDVAKRDVRALPGALTPDVNEGYSSRLALTATNFTATYDFAKPATASMAFGGGMRVLTWEAEDALANRQGVTISEFGEVGGPGFGGCPSTTPGQVAPSQTGIGTAVSTNTAALVRWVRPVQGSARITGYDIQVLNQLGQQVALQTALEPNSLSGARGAYVKGLTNGQKYHFQVRAKSGAGVGTYSSPSNVVTPSTVPGAARIATAYSGNVGGPVNAVARWMPPLTTGGAAINGYVVTALRIASNGSVASRSRSGVIAASGRTYWFPLAKGYYRFQVQARNLTGTGPLSGMSAQVIAR